MRLVEYDPMPTLSQFMRLMQSSLVNAVESNDQRPLARKPVSAWLAATQSRASAGLQSHLQSSVRRQNAPPQGFQGKDSRILSLSSREGCLLCLTGRGLIEGIKYITTPMEDGGWSWLVGCRCGWRTSWLPNVQGCESSVSATCRHGMCSLSRKQYDRSR